MSFFTALTLRDIRPDLSTNLNGSVVLNTYRWRTTLTKTYWSHKIKVKHLNTEILIATITLHGEGAILIDFQNNSLKLYIRQIEHPTSNMLRESQYENPCHIVKLRRFLKLFHSYVVT